MQCCFRATLHLSRQKYALQAGRISVASSANASRCLHRHFRIGPDAATCHRRCAASGSSLPPPRGQRRLQRRMALRPSAHSALADKARWLPLAEHSQPAFSRAPATIYGSGRTAATLLPIAQIFVASYNKMYGRTGCTMPFYRRPSPRKKLRHFQCIDWAGGGRGRAPAGVASGDYPGSHRH